MQITDELMERIDYLRAVASGGVELCGEWGMSDDILLEFGEDIVVTLGLAEKMRECLEEIATGEHPDEAPDRAAQTLGFRSCDHFMGME